MFIVVLTQYHVAVTDPSCSPSKPNDEVKSEAIIAPGNETALGECHEQAAITSTSAVSPKEGSILKQKSPQQGIFDWLSH